MKIIVMYRFIMLSLLLFSLNSCSKDASLQTNNVIQERADEVPSTFDLNTFVSYVDHYAPTCEPVYMENIQVYLMEGSVNYEDFSIDNVFMSRKTDQSGKAILEGLESGIYTVYVSTIYGNSIKTSQVGADGTNLIKFELVK